MKENQLALLMECHERELMNLAPVKATEARSLKSLITAKLVEVTPYRPESGPPYEAVKILPAGKSVLKDHIQS